MNLPPPDFIPRIKFQPLQLSFSLLSGFCLVNLLVVDAEIAVDLVEKALEHRGILFREVELVLHRQKDIFRHLGGDFAFRFSLTVIGFRSFDQAMIENPVHLIEIGSPPPLDQGETNSSSQTVCLIPGHSIPSFR